MGSYVAKEQQNIINMYKRLVEYYDSRHNRIGEHLGLIHRIITEDKNNQLSPQTLRALESLETTASRMKKRYKK